MEKQKQLGVELAALALSPGDDLGAKVLAGTAQQLPFGLQYETIFCSGKSSEQITRCCLAVAVSSLGAPTSWVETVVLKLFPVLHSKANSDSGFFPQTSSMIGLVCGLFELMTFLTRFDQLDQNLEDSTILLISRICLARTNSTPIPLNQDERLLADTIRRYTQQYVNQPDRADNILTLFRTIKHGLAPGQLTLSPIGNLIVVNLGHAYQNLLLPGEVVNIFAT